MIGFSPAYEDAVSTLPLGPLLPEICAALRHDARLLLHAPPGAGKSTLVPLALLDEPWLGGQKILVLEPRRVATRAVAQRLAWLSGEPLGQLAGYRMRLEQRVSRATRIEVITEGLLTRFIQGDPSLEGVGAIVFDEFHERSLETDLAFSLLHEVRTHLRPDLRLVMMSATLDTALLRDRLPGVPSVQSEGRAFPLDLRYCERDPGAELHAEMVKLIPKVLSRSPGDVLVFVPGGADIRALTERLNEHTLSAAGAVVVPLFGEQAYEEQRRALEPSQDGARRVVLSTPIAETSLTIPGVTTVIDSGYANVPRYDPGRGLNRLVRERISEDRANQRAGRAARLGPGVCYRMWSLHTQSTLRPFRTPEILESDLAGLVLDLAQWGARDPTALFWLTPPPAGSFDSACRLLHELGLIDDLRRLTGLGQQVASIGAPPRIGAMLAGAKQRGAGHRACELAALLEERPRRGLQRTGATDLASGVDRESSRGARATRSIAQLWVRRMGLSEKDASALSCGALAALGYPDRVARRREPVPGAQRVRYVRADGSGAFLPEVDPLAKEEWLVVTDLSDDRPEARIRQAAAVSLAELEAVLPNAFVTEERIEWDRERESVRAERVRRIGAIAVDRTPLQTVAPEQLGEVWRDVLPSIGGIGALRWSEEARLLQARAVRAAADFPELAFPDLSDRALQSDPCLWLGDWLLTVRSREALQQLDVASILRAQLHGGQLSALERLLPERIPGPDGSMRRIDYLGERPVLAATVQELFGWKQTPRIAEGRTPLLLHILSPARRPVQITDDLQRFWRETYHEVRKELRGRYPRHPWPDDPANAPPVIRRRRTE